MTPGPDADGRCQVRLLDFPVDVALRATEAFEGLRREFTLVAMRTAGAKDVPARLLDLVDALTNEYAGITDEGDRRRDEAAARGDTTLPELAYVVPRGVDDACLQLAEMLDEADEFCHRDDLLLTLASPPEAVAFRRWYLGEFVAQLRGGAPVPWSAVDQVAAAADPRLRGT